MAVRILGWLLAALFVASGIPKIIGVQAVVDGFNQMGYPGWFRLLIGVLETAGGVGLVIPATRKAAAIGLLGIMAGAVWTLWSIGQAPWPPLVVGALLAARLGLDR